jgi:hypothetical protein
MKSSRKQILESDDESKDSVFLREHVTRKYDSSLKVNNSTSDDEVWSDGDTEVVPNHEVKSRVTKKSYEEGRQNESTRKSKRKAAKEAMASLKKTINKLNSPIDDVNDDEDTSGSFRMPQASTLQESSLDRSTNRMKQNSQKVNSFIQSLKALDSTVNGEEGNEDYEENESSSDSIIFVDDDEEDEEEEVVIISRP